MNKRIHQTRLFASLAGLISMLTLSSAFAQTYTWDQWALGQEYQHCPDLYPEYWPSNNAWSQSVATNGGCSGGIVISAPSNWDPWLPIGVYPGGPGAVGVNVILGGLVNSNNLRRVLGIPDSWPCAESANSYVHAGEDRYPFSH